MLWLKYSIRYWIFWVMDGRYLLTAKTTGILPQNADGALLASSIVMMCSLYVCRIICRVYNNIWRYTNTTAYFRMLAADTASGLTAMGFCSLLGCYTSFWHYLVVLACTCLASLMSRFSYRLLYKRRNNAQLGEKPRINVAIAGAGQIGVLLANDLMSNSNSIYKPLFFIDHDSAKIGSTVAGLKVVAEDVNVYSLIQQEKIAEIFIAIADLDSHEATRLYEFYHASGCKVKLYDAPIHDNENEIKSQKRTIREFEIEDLLFRKPLVINNSDSLSYYTQKTILVTGGGGSIGSELCRQIAKCNPKRLIIFDIYENNPLILNF